jgi:putative oxygen-independent coproporphyrinogen III oxidase
MNAAAAIAPVCDAGFGLYVHWPFCLAKCPYCDFNSHVARDIDQARWRQALLAELRRAAAGTEGRRLDSVFFGGGTPSLMAPSTVAAILEAAGAIWETGPGTEVTLEANPTSVETAGLAAYRAAGVGRISIGIQSLDDVALKRLGRMHSADEARSALGAAMALFERVSFDLIYARQDQTPAAWRIELGQALRLARDHLSLYQLTIEDGTRFGELHSRHALRGLPDEDRAAELWEITQECCGAAGMPAYEVSNHARPGAESRHNLIYWRGGDWIGVGPGAHGRLTRAGRRFATERPRDPAIWLAAAEAGGPETGSSELLAPEAAAEEYLMMALRLREGADLARFAGLAGAGLAAEPIAALVGEGFLWQSGARIGTSARGRPLLDAVLRRLLV